MGVPTAGKGEKSVSVLRADAPSFLPTLDSGSWGDFVVRHDGHEQQSLGLRAVDDHHCGPSQSGGCAFEASKTSVCCVLSAADSVSADLRADASSILSTCGNVAADCASADLQQDAFSVPCMGSVADILSAGVRSEFGDIERCGVDVGWHSFPASGVGAPPYGAAVAPVSPIFANDTQEQSVLDQPVRPILGSAASSAPTNSAGLAAGTSGGRAIRRVHFAQPGVYYVSHSNDVTAARRLRRKEFRRRKVKPKYLALLTFNTSGKPQLFEAAEELARTEHRDDLRGISQEDELLALCTQESMASGVQRVMMHDRLARLGWKSVSVEATPGPTGGDSCGVVTSVKAGRAPLLPFVGHDFDMSPASAPGRLLGSLLQCNLLPGKELLVLNAYCEYGSPVGGPKNLALLERMGEAIRAHGGPFVACADWNLEPSDIEASGWLAQVGGIIVAPEQPTHKSGKIYDFGVVSQSIAHLVAGAEALMGWDVCAHRPCRLRLLASLPPVLVPRLRKPKQFPREPPSLPCRELHTDGDHLAVLGEVFERCDSISVLDSTYESLALAVEDELCYRFDRVDWCGWADPNYKGRHKFVINSVYYIIFHQLRRDMGLYLLWSGGS